MNKRRLGRGLEALLGRDEGGFEPSSLDQAELIQIAVDQIDPNPFQPRRQFNAQRDRLAGRFAPPAWHAPAGAGAGGRPALPVDRRRAPAARQHRGPASRSARASHDPRRPAGLRAGHGRKPSARRLERRRQGDSVQRVPLALRRHPGRVGRPPGRRSVDRLQFDPPARPPVDVLDAVSENEITQGHARALLGLPDAESQSAACRRIIDEHLSVRQTEALVTTGVPTPVAHQNPQRPRARHRRQGSRIFSISNSGSIAIWARPS